MKHINITEVFYKVIIIYIIISNAMEKSQYVKKIHKRKIPREEWIILSLINSLKKIKTLCKEWKRGSKSDIKKQKYLCYNELRLTTYEICKFYRYLDIVVSRIRWDSFVN